MDLVGIAISLLWILIGVVILAGVVWLVIKVIKLVFPELPPRFEQAVWLVAALLVLIALLMALAGRASVPRFWGKADLLPRPGMLTFNERDFGTPHARGAFNHGEPWPAIATVCSFNGCKSRPIGFDI